MDFNNVILKAGNKKISIAFHHSSDDIYGTIREVAIIHGNGDMDIHKYSDTLDSLLETLTEIKEELG